MFRFPKLRFSILTLLLSTVIVALGISYFFAQRKATHLAAENTVLKNDLGYIEVDDPTKFYFRELPSHAPLTWRYRVFVPDTGEWTLGIALGEINELGDIPEASSSSHFQTGQFEIVVSVSPIGKRNPGKTISVGHDLSLKSVSFYQGEVDWILDDVNKRNRQRLSYFAKGENKTIETNASGRVDLMSIYNAEQTEGLGAFLRFRKRKEDVIER